MIRLRMYCALMGISSCNAFSTVRTEVRACTVVQTPQIRWVKSHASRGSRPCRITSMPRHIWPDDQALVTLPFSTSASIRKWPSILVMGSTVIRCAISVSSFAAYSSSELPRIFLPMPTAACSPTAPAAAPRMIFPLSVAASTIPAPPPGIFTPGRRS